MTEPAAEPGRELTTSAPAGEPPAPRAPRVFTPVESAQGIMDTARFEHLGRVATLMARAGLMPDTLTCITEGKGDNAVLIPLPFEVIQARAYLIANQADLWKADPQAVAQCTSLVYGRLMYEGKLVHAIVSSRLGIDLEYEFGIYDAAKRDIRGRRDEETGEWFGEMPEMVDDQSLGVRVLGTLPGESRPRWIAGSVAMWHKGAKSPWGAPNAWPRQLRYMGAREWTRAHKPSLLLGIMTDDEVDEYQMARAVGAVAPAPPQLLTAEFRDERRAEIVQPEPKARKGKAAAMPPAAQEAPPAGEEGKGGASGAADTSPAAAAAAAALGYDDLPEDLKGAGQADQAKTEIRQPAAETSTTTENVNKAAEKAEGENSQGEASTTTQQSGATSETTQTSTSEPSTDASLIAAGEEQGEVVCVGYPERDEIYFLNGDEWTWSETRGEDRRETYKNGEPFSDAGRSKDHLIYEDHAPAGQQQAVEPEVAQAEPAAAGAPAADEQQFPEEFTTFIDAVEAAKTWTEVKSAMAAFYNTDYFKGLPSAQQNIIRGNTWETATEAKVEGLPDQALDASAFRLWIETQKDPEAITGTLQVLERQPAFEAKDPGFKDAIRRAVASRIETVT